MAVASHRTRRWTASRTSKSASGSVGASLHRGHHQSFARPSPEATIRADRSAGRMLSMQRSGAFKSDLEVSEGRFLRQKSRFTDWVTADGSSGFRAEPGRYPPLRRAAPARGRSATMIVRHLKGLEDTIGISFVNPYRDERGWAFDGRRVRRRPARLGLPLGGLPRQRPALRWPHQRAGAVGPRDGPDRQQRLGRHHPHAQQRLGRVGRRRRSTSTPSRCAPRSTRSTTGSTTTSTTASTRPGFARSQEAYDEAFDGVFRALSRLEEILGERRYLTGDTAHRGRLARVGDAACASTPSTTRTSASTAAA